MSDKVESAIVLALKDELGIAVQKDFPLGEVAATTTDILVILGEDFEE